jgi:hypothetical protein
MTNRRKAAYGAVGIFAAVVLTGCAGPGPGTTKTWCDHGNRLYSLDTENTKGETLAVVPQSEDCPPSSMEVNDHRILGDTRPMPSGTGITEGPYKPYRPAPKPGPKPVAPKVIPPKSPSYRLSPVPR